MHEHAAFFYHCLLETKALNLGVRGRAPGVPFFRDARFQRIYASLTVTVILPRGELLQIPLVAIFTTQIFPAEVSTVKGVPLIFLSEDQGSP